MMNSHGEDARHDLLLSDVPEDLLLHKQPRRNERSLEGGGGNDQNSNHYLVVDKDGVEYDPYSLAWRYLGIYMDCDIDTVNNGGERSGGDNDNNHNNKDARRRQLPEDNNNKEECPRKLLWAAYVDRRYEGNAIEEYKFYDIPTGEWDNSTCLASGTKHRCVNLNCHEPHSKYFALVGVYMETNGLYDWFEQLFKHEGMCIWNDENVYNTMTSWMEKLPSQCKKLDMRDDYDNALYMSTAPLPEGNMTLGIYTDSSCTALSDYMDYTIYITRLYQNYYEKSYYYRYGYGYYYQYYYNQGQQLIQEYKTAVATWNEYMSSFKVCQPCKAYNLLWNQQQEKGDKHERRRRTNDRLLGNNDNKNNNDGDGTEQARYNCYDAAGYTNVNQCYKFESKTSMAIAEPEDLARASKQGSILMIKAYGNVYGEGGYVSKSELDMQAIYISLAIFAACSVAICMSCIAKYCFSSRRCKVKGMSSSSLSDTFYEEDSDFDDNEHADTTTFTSASSTTWWSRFSRKKRRVNDIGTIHKHKDIESGTYTPPLRQEENPSAPHNAGDWLKIKSVSTNSFEIEMKQYSFNNEIAEKVRISKSHNLQTRLRTFISEVGTVTSLAECTATTIAGEGDIIPAASAEAPSDVAAPPPLPGSDSCIEKHDEEFLLETSLVESNHIENEVEKLHSSGNDNVLISSYSQNLIRASEPRDNILIANSVNDSQTADHIGIIDASGCEGSTESTTLNESTSLSRELSVDESLSFAGPALLLVLLVKQEAAAVHIQAEWRRFIASKLFLRKWNAAIVCQCHVRKWAAIRIVVQMRLHLPAAKEGMHQSILRQSVIMQCSESRAAVEIQRRWRGCSIRMLQS